MMLGDILAASVNAADRVEDWLTAEDVDLARSLGLGTAGAPPLADSLRGAVAEFSMLATEDDWAQLTSRMRDTDDPARACLVEMLRWRHAAEGRRP
jgi:hypothetical protein